MTLAQLDIPTPTRLSKLVVPFSGSAAPGTLTSLLLRYAIAGSGFVFLIMVISAGYKYLTSLGEPAAIQGATKQLTHALTGLLVVITAFFLIQILQAIFGLDII